MKAEELKSSELRIGNFLRAKKDYHNQFHGNGIVSSIEQSKFVILDHYPGKWFEPIPLTEEWLLKFGFSCEAKMGGDGIEFRVYHFDVLTFNTNHLWWYKVQRINDTPLEYVHQLQNFYFALTGKELTLKS